MMQVDISNVWCSLSLPELLAVEKEVFDAHMALTEEGQEPLWMTLPAVETAPIQEAARRIRESSDILVVVGIGGGCLGAAAAIELLQGRDRNRGKGKGDPQILFAGNSLSTRAWQELQRQLEGKDFSVAVISKTGAEAEPAIASRALRWMLERKYGTDGARKRTYAVTDPDEGTLRLMAREGGWESFEIPSAVEDGFSVLTAAGLLPMAAAGIDMEAVAEGFREAKEAYDLRSFENPVWLYAGMRTLLHRKGKAMELFSAFEPDFGMFGRWWQQLFGGIGGSFPVSVDYPQDLYTLGQRVRQGERNLFETMLRFDPPRQQTLIGGDYKDLDGLNRLEGKTLDEVDEQAYRLTLESHADSGVPVIAMQAEEICERTLGELIYFLQLSRAICKAMDN